METRGRYNQYSLQTILKLITAGQQAVKDGVSEYALMNSGDWNLSQWEFVSMGFHNPDFDVEKIEVREFYRIGEPINDGNNCYKNSWNFADDKPETGVSVVTTAWLHSLKSVFFGTDDETLKTKGIYKIKGFAVPSVGGDDEILICPMDWAEKTRIRTRNGLERAVKGAGI